MGAACPRELSTAATSDELLTVRLSYKQPEAEQSTESRFSVSDSGLAFEEASEDFRFAAAVASFGMLLRDSQYKGDASFASVIATAQKSLANDPDGYRSEFVHLAKVAGGLKAK